MQFNKETHIDFRRFLQEELFRRCDKNKSYSLRAFALALGMNHATLSSILSGKRPLTTKAIVKLAAALNLSSKETQRFIKAQDFPLKASTERRQREHQILSLDVFHVVADWYHDAILELTRTKNFQPDSKWIAKTLGLSRIEVQAAVDRLVRLELLEIENDKWTDLSRNNTTNFNNDLSSAALRKLQQKVLELSLISLQELPRTERDHTSLMVAMQRSDLPEVKERIKKFRFELVEFIERKSVKPDSVFQFAFSAFPLTKKET
ncbi:MAG: TIGR02147 family protein [Bdellovibrionota bacterium]